MIARPLIELLAPRVLLSAELLGTRLEIAGTSGDDLIIVHLNKRFINLLTVAYNGQQIAHFALSAVAQIEVDAGDGNDVVWIDSSLNPMAYPTTLLGGTGDDVITGGGGADLIDAGEGNDKVYGNGGDDPISGGNGRDSVWGGSGNDGISGHGGNDKLNGEAGNDTLAGDKGNDIINAGDGDDTAHDNGGVNTIHLGAGNDVAPKILGGGAVYGSDGNDTVVAVGGALVYGDDGNDHLQASWLDGGAGDDSLHGLMGDDEIRGGAGDDLIRGYDGADVLLGGDGNDAIFGGVGTDTLFGGNGADNLYGTNGHTDKYKHLAGNDDGFGQGGSDWFETNYRWDQADRNGEDQPVGVQVVLPHDPSNGQYIGGTFISSSVTGSNFTKTSGGTLHISGSGAITSTVVVNGGTLVTSGTVLATQITTQSLGPAGWLSSGAYDTVTRKFVPPPMAHKERIKAARTILEIPKGWNLGGITTARDDVVWYQVWRDGATPPIYADLVPTAGTTTGSILIGNNNTVGTITITDPLWLEEGRTINITRDINVSIGGQLTLLTPGSYTWDGSTFVPNETTTPPADTSFYNVPTLDGGTTLVGLSTPHLYDGVDNGAYRYLGVKRGTILVSGDASAVTQPKWTAIDTPILALPANVDLRIAGGTRVFRMSSRYDALPNGGPKVKAIAVDGGAIWLPTDGTEPYFSSGNR